MLALGLSAWDMIETQDFREPKIELPLLVQFLPAMMSLIVDDQVIRSDFLFLSSTETLVIFKRFQAVLYLRNIYIYFWELQKMNN